MAGRRKKVSSIVVDHENDVSDVNDLFLLSDISSSLPVEQMSKLSELADVKMRSRDCDSGFVKRDGFVEFVCDVCLKPFVCKREDVDLVCPHCFAKHHIDIDLEEVHVTQRDSDGLVQRLDEKAKERAMIHANGGIVVAKEVETSVRFTEDILNHNPKDKWEDTRKEQISLEPGSPEYLEYLEDLQDNDPSKPDDEMHVALEEHNEDLVTKGHDAEFEDNPESDDVFVDNIEDAAEQAQREKREKMDVHAAVLETLAVMAASTETDADDKVLRSDSIQTDLINDRSVSADEYKQAAESYVMESIY